MHTQSIGLGNLIFISVYFMCLGVLLVCVLVLHECQVHRIPLELELQMVVCLHVSAGNQTCVVWKL